MVCGKTLGQSANSGVLNALVEMYDAARHRSGGVPVLRGSVADHHSFRPRPRQSANGSCRTRRNKIRPPRPPRIGCRSQGHKDQQSRNRGYTGGRSIFKITANCGQATRPKGQCGNDATRHGTYHHAAEPAEYRQSGAARPVQEKNRQHICASEPGPEQ